MSSSNSPKQGTSPGFGRRQRNMVFPVEKLSKEEVKVNIKRIVSLLIPYKIKIIYKNKQNAFFFMPLREINTIFAR